MNGAMRGSGPALPKFAFQRDYTKLWFKQDDAGSNSIARSPLRIGGMAARRSVRHFIQFAAIFSA